jgi:hypothetical protein
MLTNALTTSRAVRRHLSPLLGLIKPPDVCRSTGLGAKSIQPAMPSRKILSLALLAILATLVCLIQQQRATKARLQKQLAELQEQHAAQKMRQEEYRQRLEKIRHAPERLRLQRKPQGDHWLPGELDRLFNRPLPSDEA